jgi:hypothetical protein
MILYAFLICSMHATCLAHIILLGAITLATCGKDYKF